MDSKGGETQIAAPQVELYEDEKHLVMVADVRPLDKDAQGKAEVDFRFFRTYGKISAKKGEDEYERLVEFPVPVVTLEGSAVLTIKNCILQVVMLKETPTNVNRHWSIQFRPDQIKPLSAGKLAKKPSVDDAPFY